MKTANSNPTKPRFYRLGRTLIVRIGPRVFLSPLLILSVTLALAACDFSFLLGKKSTSSSSGGNTSTPATSLIQSYVVTAAQNGAAGISGDITATINPPDVSIVLPYSVIQNATKLTTTVTCMDGYTISPSGNYVLSDGMILVLTKTADNSVYNYTLHVSVDPGSIAFLNLAKPFYYDTTGTKQDITNNSTIALNGPTNTYTLTLNTDSFQLSYPQLAVQAIFARSIGFTTATVPHNSFANLSTVLAGAVMPYTVTVQSANQQLTNVFNLLVKRTLSHSVAITAVNALVENVYQTTTTYSLGDSTLSSWENATFHCIITDGYETEDVANTYNPPNNYQAYTGDPSWANGTCYCTSSGGQINANISSINAAPAAIHSFSTSNLQTITPGASWTVSSTASNPPSINPTSAGTTSQTVSVLASAYGVIAVNQGRGSYSYYPATGTASASFGVPYAGTTTYAVQNYYKFDSITILIPTYVAVNSVVPFPPVSTWTSSPDPDGKDTDFIFNIVPTTSHLMGTVAQLTLKAEDGTQTAYYLIIN